MRAFLCLPSHPGVTTPLPILAFGSWDHQDTQALLLEVKSDMIHNDIMSDFTVYRHCTCVLQEYHGLRNEI